MKKTKGPGRPEKYDSPTVAVSLRIPENLLKEVHDWAAFTGVSFAEALNTIIQQWSDANAILRRNRKVG